MSHTYSRMQIAKCGEEGFQQIYRVMLEWRPGLLISNQKDSVVIQSAFCRKEGSLYLYFPDAENSHYYCIVLCGFVSLPLCVGCYRFIEIH